MSDSLLVLVVEDEDLIAQVLGEVLPEAGFAVAMVGTGKQAIARLDADCAKFRALITDVNLPGKLTGWDVARHARELNETLPIIYMTGASANEWASKGVPGSVLIVKPFAPAQIITALAQLVTAASQPTVGT